MAKRAWALPDIQELSKEQERARLLPKEGCHLIVGGPGTGKSVLALLRTRRYHRPKGGQDYVFLVYNRLLLEASRKLVGGAVNAHPWKAWFTGRYRRMLAQPCPIMNGNAYDIVWEQVKAGIYSARDEIASPLTPFVIIDEGQDMPRAFYSSLAKKIKLQQWDQLNGFEPL